MKTTMREEDIEDETSNATALEHFDEINVHCDKKDKAMYLKYYLSAEERRSLIQEVGDAACMLYEYYLRMASIPNQVITDDMAAEYFGWNTRKVRRYRQALTNAGWYDSARYTIAKVRKGISYYIGKEAVAKTR